ncbi:hypothetical protein ACUXHI_001496 [Staphylococcus haemolyticus]
MKNALLLNSDNQDKKFKGGFSPLDLNPPSPYLK